MAVMLIEWVVTSAFLILVVLALRAVLGKRMSARLRYALWAVVLVRLLVPVQLFTSPIAGTRIFSESSMEQDIVDWPSAPTAPNTPDNVLSLGGQDGPSATLSNFPQAPNPPIVPDAPEPPAAPDLTKAPVWLGWTWLAGAAAVALVLLVSNLRFYWRLRRERAPLEGADCPLRVYAAVGLPSPCLFGMLRPAIYVTPEAADDPDMLRHVIAHEYTHYRQGDHFWSLLRCGALAAHWWNPLVWLAAVLSQRDAELACDEGALKRLGDEERAGYGGTLLALVTAKPRPVDLLRCATTMAGDKKSLKERISRIACAPKRVVWAVVAAVLVTALACVCAFGQAEEEREADPAPTDSQELPLWPYGVSEMVYTRDEGGFGGDFTIHLAHDGKFSYYEGGLSSYIGMGTWTRDGDVICLADTVGENLDNVGIKYYYFRVDDGDLIFQAKNSDRFMYLDVADGERFSYQPSWPEGDAESVLSLTRFAAVAGMDIPKDVLDAVEDFVQSSYEGWRGDGSLTGTARFDNWRVTSLEGPWYDVTKSAELEIWRVNYELHTSTPERVKVMSGMALSEDGWFRPNYPDSRYLLFTVQDGKRVYLTDINETEYQPGSERFHADLERMAARAVTPDSIPATDLNRNGVQETLRVTAVEDRQQLEVWEDGKVIWQNEGYFAHMGWNAVFLCTLDGEDYLLRYTPYMGQGWCTYSYQLFTLSKDGAEQTVRENSVVFDVDFRPSIHESFDPSAIAGFMNDVNSLLAHSVQLINTDENLLSAFEKEGRLYDSLWWLDSWEPTFVRNKNKTLLDNLEIFKAVMEEQYYTEKPVVFPVDEAGTDILLRYKGEQKRFQGQWDYNYQPERQVQEQTRIIDLNHDGRDEIVFPLVWGHGTGCYVEHLYIFDAETLEQYDTSKVEDMIFSQVSSYADEERFYVSAPGLNAEIEKPKDIDYNYADHVNFGDYYRFLVENGRLYARFGAALDGGDLCYRGTLQVELRLENGKLVCAGFKYLTEDCW